MCVSPRLRGRTDAHFNVLVNALHYYALPALPAPPSHSLPQSAISPPIPAAVRSRHAVTPEYDELLITPKENLDQEEEEMEEEMGETGTEEEKPKNVGSIPQKLIISTSIACCLETWILCLFCRYFWSVFRLATLAIEYPCGNLNEG